MPQPPNAPSQDPVPLVVDLDGTAIRTDLLWEHLALWLRCRPLGILQVLFWWTRGRARLKQELTRRVSIDPATLPVHEPFVAWLKEQKTAGRKIILATASDIAMARPIAERLGIFDEVLASDGKTNLRSKNKLARLVARFGERGFDYAGNSSADLAVWAGAREAIVVNAGRGILQRAQRCANVGKTFLDGYQPFFIAGRFFDTLFWRSGYLMAVVAGLILAMAFQKTNIAGFAWVAPALLVFAAVLPANATRRDVFRIGYLSGLSFWLVSLYWLLYMPAPGFSLLGWIALCVFLAVYPAVWLSVVVQGSRFKVQSSWASRSAWALGGAAVWVALEMFRGWFLGGFPWSFLGASQCDMVPLIQLASITGVHGVSFLVVWTSLSFFSAARMIYQKPVSRFAWQSEIILPLTVVVIVFCFGMVRLQERPLPGPRVLVKLVQPAFPQTLIWDERESTNRFQQLLKLSEEAVANYQFTGIAPDSSVLVWPESAVPDLDEATYIAITNLVRTHHTWLICNADDVVPRADSPDKNDVFNGAFLFDPDGQFAGVYHKQALVIFGEYIPLEHTLPFIKYLTPIPGSFAAGTGPVPFPLERRPPARLDGYGKEHPPIKPDASATITASPLICFEDTFPGLARKAATDDTDFLVNLTNDGWFGNSAEQWQHEANAIFRAVENGIPLVRCANNGITCWIDSHGRVRQVFRDETGSVYGPGALTFILQPGHHTPTFYNRHGNWFGWACIGLALIVSARQIRLQKLPKHPTNL